MRKRKLTAAQSLARGPESLYGCRNAIKIKRWSLLDDLESRFCYRDRQIIGEEVVRDRCLGNRLTAYFTTSRPGPRVLYPIPCLSPRSTIRRAALATAAVQYAVCVIAAQPSPVYVIFKDKIQDWQYRQSLLFKCIFS